jgi:hypothetical protein
VVAARTGGRVWPDALAHPVSVLLFDVLMAHSLRGHRRGSLSWRGRAVSGPARRTSGGTARMGA